MPKFCDACGALLGEAKRFCPSCGAPILGTTTPARPDDGNSQGVCERCGSPLGKDALYCEQCGARVVGKSAALPAAAEAAAKDIQRRYALPWLILVLTAAVALFAVPDTLKNADLPEFFDSPLAWAVLLAASLCISIAFYFLLRKARKALQAGDPIPGEDDRYPPGAAASIPVGMGVTLAVSLLAAVVLLAVNLLGFGGGGGTGGILRRQTPVPAAADTPAAASPTPEITEQPVKKVQSLEGVWTPTNDTMAAEGVSGPNMVTMIPSILFRDGRMFMGYGSSASEIYEDSCMQSGYISNYDGYPFTLEDGIITISDPYGNTTDQKWTIGSDLIIVLSMGTFEPSGGAQIIEKEG